MAMALVTLFFVIGSLRTNLVFVLIFVFIDLAFVMLMASYWTLAEGKTDVASKCQIVRTSTLCSLQPSTFSSVLTMS